MKYLIILLSLALLMACSATDDADTVDESQADDLLDDLNGSDEETYQEPDEDLCEGLGGIDETTAIPGEVSLTLPNTITKIEALAIVKKYDLEGVWNVNSPFSAHLSTQNSCEDYIEELMDSPLIFNAFSRGGICQAYFVSGAEIEEAENFLERVQGIVFFEILYSPKSLLVKVPIGEEQEWICRLAKEPLVTSASPNYLAFTN